MERTEWPSAAKLEELRAGGFVPYSYLSSACAAAASLAVALYATGAECGELIRQAHTLAASASSVWGGAETEGIINLVEKLSRFLLVIVGAASLGVILCGLLQTRFLFLPHTVIPALGRLFSTDKNRHGPGFFGKACWYIGSHLLALFISMLSLWLFLYSALALLKHSSAFARLPSSLGGLSSIMALSLVCFGVLGVLSWVITWFFFMRQARMSRFELEAETKEEQ